MTKKNGVGTLVPLLVGTGIGVAAGWLLASQRGRRLRRDIAEGINHGAEQLSVSGKKLNQRLGKVVAQARDTLHDAVEAGENAYTAARDS